MLPVSFLLLFLSPHGQVLKPENKIFILTFQYLTSENSCYVFSSNIKLFLETTYYDRSLHCLQIKMKNQRWAETL